MRFYTNGNDNILRHLYVGNCMREIERKMQTHVCIAKLFIAYMQCTFVASHIHFYCVCISNNGNKLHHRNVRELTIFHKTTPQNDFNACNLHCHHIKKVKVQHLDFSRKFKSF